MGLSTMFSKFTITVSSEVLHHLLWFSIQKNLHLEIAALTHPVGLFIIINSGPLPVILLLNILTSVQSVRECVNKILFTSITFKIVPLIFYAHLSRDFSMKRKLHESFLLSMPLKCNCVKYSFTLRWLSSSRFPSQDFNLFL